MYYYSLLLVISVALACFLRQVVFSSMRTALNTIYGVRVSINPLFGKLKDFGMILLVVVFYRSEF